MNKIKMTTLGVAVVAAGLLAGCQKEEKAPVAEKTATAPAPATRQMIQGQGDMITLSELQKGEVIRGASFSDGTAMSDVKTIDNSGNAQPVVAEKKAPVLSYSDVMNCQSGSCKVDDLQTAKSKSETLKSMLQRLPGLHNHATAKAQDVEIFEEQKLMAGDAGNYNEIKIPVSALRSRHDDLAESRLPGSGHSALPATADQNLWPGGIPLEAEIDPAVSGF